MSLGLLFTYVFTYVGAAASIFKPYWGLLIYIAFSIIRPEALWFWSVPRGNYSRIVAIALLVGWVINGLGSWRLGRARPIMFCVGGVWIAYVLSAINAANATVAWGQVEAMSKVFLPVFVGISLIDSVAKLKQLAWVIFLSHALIAFDFNETYLRGFNKLHQVGFGGMDNNCVAITLVTCVGLGIFLGFGTRNWWLMLAAFAGAGLMVHAVLFSFSRGGMLGLIVTGGVAFLLLEKRLIHYTLFAFGVVVALRLAGPEVLQRFWTAFADEKLRDASAQSRLEMWAICLRIMAQAPLLGLGPHHFPLYAHTFGLTKGKEAHNLWLQMGAEIGILGLGFLVAMYALCVLRLWPLVWRKTPVPDPFFRAVARMVIAALSGFAVSATFVSLAGLEVPYYIVLLGAGALKLYSASPQGQLRTTGNNRIPVTYFQPSPAGQPQTVHAAGLTAARRMPPGGPLPYDRVEPSPRRE